MPRDSVLNFWVETPEPIVITAKAAGDIFAHRGSHHQAEFLVSASASTKEFYWAFQCREIVECMTNDECFAVRMMLDTLIEHLEAVPTERRAAALAAEIVDGVAAVVEECRT